jgi:hypothetical protein
MEHVDYQKLAEQYASFLVAIGGVSITVLALVLNLNANQGESDESTEGDPRSFLVTALVVAALSCFVGAQMMAETAAFTYQSKKADPLFLLASTNIFVAIVLVFFALIFFPLTSRKVHLASIKPISILFFLIVAGALYWAILAGLYRMLVPGRELAIGLAVVAGLAWAGIFSRLSMTKSKRWFLWATFTPSALLTVGSLLWFTWIYSNGNAEKLKTAGIQEVVFFGISIALSYASLLVAGIKTMSGNKFLKRWLRRKKERLRKQKMMTP